MGNMQQRPELNQYTLSSSKHHFHKVATAAAANGPKQEQEQ